MSSPRLYLNHDADYDWLLALEFGRVDEGQTDDAWVGVSDAFGYLTDPPGGPVVGFAIKEFSEFDAEAPDVREIWSAPHFDAPVLGLSDVPAGEIVLAARALFGTTSSVNRQMFDAATGAEAGEEGLGMWIACLQAGDSMAHFGLGYTLYDLGRYKEAYRHLRHYTEIAPRLSWGWCWRGKAAHAIGEIDEARSDYLRAIDLEHEGGEETDATELLADLDHDPPPDPGPASS